MRLHSTSLASRILMAVLGIVVVTMTIGLWLYVSLARSTADANATERASNIAAAVGDMSVVASALAAGDPQGTIRTIADKVVRDTGAAYVVVIGANGLRYSHPNPALIGQRIAEPVVALDGHIHTGVDNGSLGRSANARAPIRDGTGKPIGEVSVGILETKVSAQLHQFLEAAILYSVLALAVGVVASLILARAIKRATFGLEPAEIVALVQEREAMLHGIREGVIAFDPQGRMNVLNDEARRLLGLTGAATIGQQLDELVPPGRLHDILSGAVTDADAVAVTDENLLVVNRMPVTVAGRKAGWVVTIRDRTEMEALLRQLDSVESITTALRAQEHEFSNRLHALSVLLELGEIDEATSYAGQLTTQASLVADDVRARIGPPVVAALLLAKMTVAAERGVQVSLHPDSRMLTGARDHTALLSVLGNLVDNAVDAVAADGSERRPREVVVQLVGTDHEVSLSVWDNGPGIPHDQLEQVFVDGYSTKEPRGGLRRGVGLALVHRLVARSGGSIVVTSQEGTRFDVRLPLDRLEVVS
jgi:two-component system, CitB family, sensor kinase